METLHADEGGVTPLDESRLRELVIRPGGPWRELRVVAETGSTNADLLAQARAGAPEGLVLAAESQTAGRGRLGRQWQSRAGAGLTFSVLLRPDGVAAERVGWAPLLAGVAAVAAVRATTAVDARLKWPNDLLAGERKLAGILAEAADGAVVIGIGLNVCARREELPVQTATSLLVEERSESGHGAPGPGTAMDRAPGVDRERVLVALLRELAGWYTAWRDQPDPGNPDACGLRPAYLRDCATLGRQVTALLPGGESVTGVATGVDRSGQLEIGTDHGLVAVSAGDVVHLR